MPVHSVVVELLATAGDGAVDHENDKRAADGECPRSEVEEAVDAGAEECSTDEATEKCADYTEHQRDEPSATLLTRQDELGDGASDKAEEEKSEETHCDDHFLFCCVGRLSRGVDRAEVVWLGGAAAIRGAGCAAQQRCALEGQSCRHLANRLWRRAVLKCVLGGRDVCRGSDE